MLIFLIVFPICSSLDQINQIKEYLNQESYDLAFELADKTILKEGVHFADNILFLLRGNASIKLHNYQQAISDLSRFLSENNNYYQYQTYQNEAHLLRAIAYLRIGELDKSQVDAEESDDGQLILNVIKAQNILKAAKSAESNQDFKISFNFYSELIRICPYCSTFIREATYIALSNNEYTLKYLEILSDLIKEYPKNNILLIQRANIYQELYRISDALYDYNKIEIINNDESQENKEILRNFEDLVKKIPRYSFHYDEYLHVTFYYNGIKTIISNDFNVSRFAGRILREEYMLEVL